MMVSLLGAPRPELRKKRTASSIPGSPVRFLALRGSRGHGGHSAPPSSERRWLQRRETVVDGELGFGLVRRKERRGSSEGAEEHGEVFLSSSQGTGEEGGPARSAAARGGGPGGDAREDDNGVVRTAATGGRQPFYTTPPGLHFLFTFKSFSVLF